MNASALNPIDTRHGDFLSYGPPVGARRPGMEELRVTVEPERDALRFENAHFKPIFPLRKGKIQRPLLPEDTLRRDRLLDWMAGKARGRIIYIIAEAGFGKTTLVADFTRRSRIRTFWYRLDEDDTDGLVMIRYIVASARTVDPELFRQTDSLLNEPSLEPVNLDSVFPTFMADFERLGDVPSILVLDDYYMAEHVASIRATLEKLIERAPANLTFVFATRRTPDLSVAALRARGELGELGKEDLRLGLDETRELFEIHNQPLEPDVLEAVQARTDGWAASLQLVKTAVDGRTRGQIRAFVNSLSGAEGHLYDYLAQEVVGDLAPDMRDFLLRAAILEDIEIDTSASIANVSEPDARKHVAEAQRVGLLSRAEGAGGWRPHPLVREFLLVHLEREVGGEGLAQLHRDAARVFEPISWRLAARHWASAGEPTEVRRVLTSAVPTIVASGDLSAAEELMNEYPDDSNPWYGILRIRGFMDGARYMEAQLMLHEVEPMIGKDPCLSAAWAQCSLALGSDLRNADLHSRGYELLVEFGDAEQVAIAQASKSMEDSVRGSLDLARLRLTEASQISRALGHHRYVAISLLNLSEVETAAGDFDASLRAAEEAVELLSRMSVDLDTAAAIINLARARMFLGDVDRARQAVQESMQCGSALKDPEWFCEVVESETQYGHPNVSHVHQLERLADTVSPRSGARCKFVAARVALRRGDTTRARRLLGEIDADPFLPGFASAFLCLSLQVQCAESQDRQSLEPAFEHAEKVAFGQQAWSSWKTVVLMRSAVLDSPPLGQYIETIAVNDAAYLSAIAELLIPRLGHLSDKGWQVLMSEAMGRRGRWTEPLRRFVSSVKPQDEAVRRAVELLEAIGTGEDLPLLRKISKSKSWGVPNAGKGLTRRLADRVYVEDLGRLSLRIGQGRVSGGEIRRKPLSLLAFLLTRPQFSATREQIEEAIWPDLDPQAADNSLNQTSYFLRRILEPTYTEKSTAGYIVSRADLIWLDSQLITSRSTECQALLTSIRRDPKPEKIAQLAYTYTARFATDFLYDDWSCSYRDSLHAAFLDRVERSIRDDLRIGAFERGIALAQQALMADPEAEEIELLLLRLYLATGAHGAAAEQYAHYAAVVREQLGVEPPPLESL